MAQDNAFVNGETGLAHRTRLIANADDAETRLNSLESGTYGGIYAESEAGTVTLTNQFTFYQYTQFEGNFSSSNMTPDYTNDEITIDSDGDYYISCTLDQDCTQSETYSWKIFNNGTAITGLVTQAAQGTVSRVPVAISGIVTLSDTDVLDLRLSCISAAGTTGRARNVQLNVIKVGA